MPALGDVLGTHADADARPDFVARDRGGQEFPAAHAGAQLGDCDQRRQHYRADVQHALAVHVVEFEALHLRAVDERRVRRRQPLAGAPYRACLCRVELGERRVQDTAPFKIGAVDRAPERIQHQQLDACQHFRRDRLVAQVGAQSAVGWAGREIASTHRFHRAGAGTRESGTGGGRAGGQQHAPLMEIEIP